MCSTWVEDLNVAVGWERLEGDRTVGMQSVGSVLPDERGFEASICHGVGCELVARFFEESIVGEGVGDTGGCGEDELLGDGVEELESCGYVLRA